MDKKGFTRKEVASDLFRQRVTSNFSSLPKNQLIGLIKQIGVTRLTPGETLGLIIVKYVRCPRGHLKWVENWGGDCDVNRST